MCLTRQLQRRHICESGGRCAHSTRPAEQQNCTRALASDGDGPSLVAPPAGTTARLYLLGLLRHLLSACASCRPPEPAARPAAAAGDASHRGQPWQPVCQPGRRRRTRACPANIDPAQPSRDLSIAKLLRSKIRLRRSIPGNANSEVKKSAPPSAPVPGLPIALSRSSATASRPLRSRSV